MKIDLHVCVCVCVCTHTCTHVHVCMCKRKERNSTFLGARCPCQVYPLIDLIMFANLATLVSPQTPGILLFLPSWLWDYRHDLHQCCAQPHSLTWVLRDQTQVLGFMQQTYHLLSPQVCCLRK